MELTAAAALGRRLMDEHGLRGWELGWDHARRRAGQCRHDLRRITLSRHLTALYDETQVRDTVLHEIAHALVGPRHGHDAVWRAQALRIGGSGRRTTDPGAPAVEGDWVGVCPAGHRVTRFRRPSRPLACGRCGPRFDPANLFSWWHRGVPVRAAGGRRGR
ncbi:sprT domain-containing protein [Xylanimonas oleitrophica]|uniref:SprT domain-containing protein n=1 Tax=Xylanimonas oleitrophica TaxID=2607479 RepID=A0A2W5WN93_9MICO|nr:SprT-like domain-containing protein [Xylanimonas oleitrophica]PZR52640.1 sprT domain-containing protein [Xylanimonas oleitrophica]